MNMLVVVGGRRYIHKSSMISWVWGFIGGGFPLILVWEIKRKGGD